MKIIQIVAARSDTDDYTLFGLSDEGLLYEWRGGRMDPFIARRANNGQIVERLPTEAHDFAAAFEALKSRHHEYGGLIEYFDGLTAGWFKVDTVSHDQLGLIILNPHRQEE